MELRYRKEAHTLKRYLSSNNHTKPLEEVLPNHGVPCIAVEVMTCGEGPREDCGLCNASLVSVEHCSGGNDHPSWSPSLGGF